LAGKGRVAAPIGAMASALSSLGCCLPLAFLAAVGAASASVLLQTLRPWLLGLSVMLLGVGFVQQYRGARCGLKNSPASTVILWTAAVLVVVMILFPQAVAGFLADCFSRRGQ
jgi:hypothetical protein